MTDIAVLWAYLSATPLTWLTATLVAYLGASTLSRRLGHSPLLNPVLIAVAAIALLLTVTQTSYARYFEGAQFIHFLLGPATVALAVPLMDNRQTIRQVAAPIIVALLVGSCVAVVSVIVLAQMLGLPDLVILSLSPKSTTAPVAIGVAEAVGGIPALTAVFVILTGVTGAIIVTPMMNLLGVKDWRARGLAAGLAAHGIGTARAFQVNDVAGAYAGVAMAINAVLTSLLVPVLIYVLM